MSEFKRRLKRFLREHGPRSKPKLPPDVEIIREDLADEERRARVARAEEMVGKQMDSTAEMHNYILGPEALAKRGVTIRQATREDFIEHARMRGIALDDDGYYYHAPGHRIRLNAERIVAEKLDSIKGWIQDETMLDREGLPVKYSWYSAECDAKTGALLSVFD